MLAFIDESGDTGRKTAKGSSAYFVVSMVLFLDHDEALRCDQAIDQVRAALRKAVTFEFHYSRNANRVTNAFMDAVRPFSFSVITVAIDKSAPVFHQSEFNSKSSFYNYACTRVLTTALPYLDSTTVVVDRSGSGTFQTELARHIRQQFKAHKSAKIKKVKQQDSAKNNLLQLADYCASITNRHLQGKANAADHYRQLATKTTLHRWPGPDRFLNSP